MSSHVGVVPVVGRGELPFATLHGTSLIDHATNLLRRAGVEVVASEEHWDSVQELVRNSGGALVLQDPLCPLTPTSFVGQAIAASADAVAVGCRPVTDTIKSVTQGRVGATVDRDSLVAVASPIVLPAPVVAGLDAWPELSDFAGLVTWLRERFAVTLLDAPALGRRVEDESAVLVLEAFGELQR